MDESYSVSDETDYRHGTDIEDGIYNISGTVNFGEHVKFRDPEAIIAEVETKLKTHYETLLKEYPSMKVIILASRILDEPPFDWWVDYSVEDKDGNEDINRQAREFWKKKIA